MGFLRRRFTYANIAATLAIVVALGSGAYAMSVTGKDVKNGSLTGKDIRNGSLTGKDVRNKSLKKKDLSFKALKAGDILIRGGNDVTGPIPVPSDGSWVTLADVPDFHLQKKSNVLFTNNVLASANNDSAQAADFNYRVLIDGTVASTQTVEDVLAPGSTRRSNMAILAGAVKKGTHNITIQVSDNGGASLSLQKGSWNAIGAPTG